MVGLPIPVFEFQRVNLPKPERREYPIERQGQELVFSTRVLCLVADPVTADRGRRPRDHDGFGRAELSFDRVSKLGSSADVPVLPDREPLELKRLR